MEKPSAALLVHRKYRSVGNDEGVSGATGFLKHFLYFSVIRMIEVQYQESIGANVEIECSFLNVFSEFF